MGTTLSKLASICKTCTGSRLRTALSRPPPILRVAKVASSLDAGSSAAEAEEVRLICQLPPIEKMDNSLNTLTACRHLSLSTNCIEKMINLPNLSTFPSVPIRSRASPSGRLADSRGVRILELSRY